MNYNDIRLAAHSRRGIITLCIGDHTGGNIIFSLKLAEEIAAIQKRGKVLYLNTVQSQRQLAGEIRKHVSKEYSSTKAQEDISYLHCPSGKLNSMERDIRKHLERGIKFIILNSLEFSSKDARRRDDFMFQCMTWASEFDAAVLLFSESKATETSEWRIVRGKGIGKFIGCAGDVICMDDYSEDLENFAEGCDETEGIGYWLEKLEKEEQMAALAAAEAEEKKVQEAKLLEQAKQLASEGAFLAADVPIYKAWNEAEEKRVGERFRQRHHTFRPQPNESAEHFRKRLLAALAIELTKHLPIYNAVLTQDKIEIVHSADPEKPFSDELLPEGGALGDYFSPDKLPIRGERKPRLPKPQDASAKS